jgi:NAD(P)-dependent dehydrogenase (short-subunit alcohol dehydrogenase family)
MPELRDRRILITGGARGLGRAFAESALAAGARVAIADILEDAGRATAKEIGATFVSLDLAVPQSIDGCAARAADALGGLDGLINTVNVRGTWLATRAALPHLRRSGRGRVINIASDTALWGAPRLLAYVASKGAVIAMTKSLARELGPDGITVNAVAPGLTLVEATEYVPAARHRLYAEGRAIQRAQVPEDVCGAVTYLLSDAAGFVTGQLLAVNGGFVMH